MLETILTIIGIVGFVITILHFLYPTLGRSIVERSRWPRYNWETIQKLTSTAKERIYILQTWLPDTHMELPHWEQALSIPKVKFHILLMDKKLIYYRKLYRPTGVQDKLGENLIELGKLAKKYNHPGSERKLIFKFYSCIPFGPIYIIDDDIYWGIYLSHMDSLKGPVFKSKVTSVLGKMIFNSWEKAWDKASANTKHLNTINYNHHEKTKHYEELTLSVNRKLKKLKKLIPIAKSEYEKNPTKTVLCIMRHEETDLNTLGIFAGQLNIGINALGRKNAIDCSHEMQLQKWTKIYSSPLRRCIETIELSLPKLSNNIDLRDELMERGMGEIEGSLKSEYANLTHYKGLETFYTEPIGGESYFEVFSRLIPFIEEINDQLIKGDKILICSHEAPIRMILMAIEGINQEIAISKRIENGEFFYFTFPNE